MTLNAARISARRTTSLPTAGTMDCGDGVEMFTTGLCRQGGDMMCGDGVALFTTGLQRRQTRMTCGGGVGLFTTGLA